MLRLVRDSGVLDANSPYAYLLLCDHFADTCLAAFRCDELVGFVTAYRPPIRPNSIFVWQIGVAATARGCGLGKRLLRNLLALPACRDVRFLEATITPSNAASWRLFESVARDLGVRLETQVGFRAEDFGSSHEEERLLIIGPLDSIRPTSSHDS